MCRLIIHLLDVNNTLNRSINGFFMLAKYREKCDQKKLDT